MKTERRTNREMVHAVARMHYDHELSQKDIASRLQISTATVSRLIHRAKVEGIVRIEIAPYNSEDDLAHELRDALGLEKVALAKIMPASENMTALAGPVGRLLVEANFGPHAVIGLGWGRTVWDIVNGELPRLTGIRTVPMCGGVPEAAAHHQLAEICRRAAAQFGGTPQFLHVPHLLTPEARGALGLDQRIRATLDLWNEIDAFIVGIGKPYGGSHCPGEIALTPTDPVLVEAAGDVLLRYFRPDGRPLDWTGEHELVAISRQQMSRVPLRIGAAVSKEKAPSIVGAVRSKLINALVTDGTTAQHILNIVKNDAANVAE